jgi:hypothetical protein
MRLLLLLPQQLVVVARQATVLVSIWVQMQEHLHARTHVQGQQAHAH